MSGSTVLLVLIIGTAIALALVLFLPTRRSRTQPGSTDDGRASGPMFRDDDQYWYAGVFYYNPNDPEPFIPKRYGFGWTVNFGHPMGKLIAALMVLLLLLPLALSLFDPGFAAYGCHPSGCHPVP